MADVDKQIISSKFVKEIATLNGNIDSFVSRSVVKAIKNKI
jgi:pantetheine-phosphate adenylyltransferase